MKIIGIIPARYQATRFPGKILAPILGKPMILWVLEGAMQSEMLDDLIVATDSPIIQTAVQNAGFNAQLTRDDHQSGTDRIWEIAETLNSTHVLNIQGDEPLLNGEILNQLISVIHDKPNTQMATLVTDLPREDADDPNRVKVVIDENMRAIYFSRSKIPYLRSQINENPYLLHVGIYLYKKNFLGDFVKHGQSNLEEIERLEQLRALSMGAKIDVVKTNHKLMGVDTPEDIEHIEKLLKGSMLA